MFASGISILIILLAPLLATKMSFQFAGNIFVRFLLVGWLFYSIRIGPMEGMLALLAVVTVLTERSHEILTSFPLQQPNWPLSAGQAGVPQQIMADTPHGETVHYETPQEEQGVSVTETHGEVEKEVLYEDAKDIQDSNPRIGEVAQGEAAASFYEQKGLA